MTQVAEKKSGNAIPTVGIVVPTVSNRKEKMDEVAVKTLEHLQTLEQSGNLVFPKDYSKENAIKGAMLYLSELKDKDGNFALDVCTVPSMANSLIAMCIDGLSVWKKQGYFIPYGKELHWQRDYRGNELIAKRDAGVKEVNAQVIYQDDDFAYEIDVNTGRQRLIKHTRNIDVQDIKSIKGAYAVVVFKDNTTDLEVMTIIQIKQAWMQGFGGGNTKAHQNFSDRMARKTVINRALNNLVGSSDDSELPEDENKPVKARNETIKEKGGKKELNIQDTSFEEVKDDLKSTKEGPPDSNLEADARNGTIKQPANAEAQANEHSGSHSAEATGGPDY